MDRTTNKIKMIFDTPSSEAVPEVTTGPETITAAPPAQEPTHHRADRREDCAEGKSNIFNIDKFRNEIIDTIAAAKAAAEREGFKPVIVTPTDENHPGPLAPDGRVYIDDREKDLTRVTPFLWKLITDCNKPPRLFMYGGNPVRLEFNEHDLPVLTELNQNRLRQEISRVSVWTKNGNPYDDPRFPRKQIIEDMLVYDRINLPPLKRLVYSPVFSPSGKIMTQPGYSIESQVFFIDRDKLRINHITDNPTRENVQKAINLIDEMIFDFPFDGAADRAHIYALLLLPFARNMILGPTPLHDIEATGPGSGKGLLADCALYPSTGGTRLLMSPARDDDEYRKRITAALMAGAEIIYIDNANTIDSAALAAAITADTWSDRVLGVSRTVSIPITCIWLCTANNPVLSSELARRTIRTRLNPTSDKPWLKTDFKHPDLRSWVMSKRAELIEAALIIIQSWIAAGQPKPEVKPLGTFEKWSYVMGGILQNAGVPGFLSNVIELYESADIEGEAWRIFTSSWWDKYQNEPVKISDLFEIAREIEGLPIHSRSESGQKTALGKNLSRQRERIFGNLRIIKSGQHNRAITWALQKIDENVGNLFNPEVLL